MVASYAADVAWRQIQEEKRSNCTGSDLLKNLITMRRHAQSIILSKMTYTAMGTLQWVILSKITYTAAYMQSFVTSSIFNCVFHFQ